MIKIHLKSDCLNRSNENGIKEPILFSFSSDEPPGYREIKIPRRKLYKESRKVSFYFYLEDDKRRTVILKGEAKFFMFY